MGIFYFAYRNQTGRKRKVCPFYEELDDVLGCRHSIQPPILFDTAAQQQQDHGDSDDEAGRTNDDIHLPEDHDEEMHSEGHGDDVDEDDVDAAAGKLSACSTTSTNSDTATSSNTSDKV